MSGSEGTAHKRWHCHAHCAINKESSAILNRLKQTRIGAAGAHRQCNIASVAEYNRLTCRQVSGNDTERNTHIFKPKAFQEFVQKQPHALRADQSRTADGRSRHVP